jgi:hypothetical protein
MKKKVLVLAEAASDIERGIDFYDAIYYRDMEGTRQVVAVLDLRQSPDWIRDQLSACQ